MPMVLRPRKSIHQTYVPESESEPESELESVPSAESSQPAEPTYEESDESEAERVHDSVMETHRTDHPAQDQLEEEAAAEEGDPGDLKDCSVVLDRLSVDDKAVKLEEKDDMNRKGAKPASRIPTFHKRPPGASPSVELPVPKKDAPVHPAQPNAEPSKSKPAEGRALLQPSVRIPRMGFEAPSPFTSTEHAAAVAHAALTSTPKSWSLSESVQCPPMSVSPRPALRPEQGSEQHLPEKSREKTFELEADTSPDAPESQIPCEGSVSDKPQGAAEEVPSVKSRITVSPSGDVLDEPEEAIMDEEPPWETGPTDALELKDSRSSSDAECEEDLAGDNCNSVELKEHHEAVLKQEGLMQSAPPAAPEQPAKSSSSKSAKSSRCSGFGLFCFMPAMLLLLGGFSLHVWNYGLPMSVAQLAAQLELHMLEGFMPQPCSSDCRVELVESIPEGLSSPSPRMSIANSWLQLLDEANSSVHIAAFYFTLRDSDLGLGGSSDYQGRMVFEQLKQLEAKGVKLHIAVNAPQTSAADTAELEATGAEVREVDLRAITGGIVHTKLWVVDKKHFYLGSANMDWRSLSQVKEVGLSVQDCSCLAQDASRIFDVYWSLGGANSSLPPYWPARLSALSSSQNPLRLKFNGVPARVYLSSAPPHISARGRSDDLATILSVIDDAQKFIHISVMDYLPLSEFTQPLRFWPAIDSALRAAACTRAVEVRLLVSCWKHSPAAMFTFLQSLLVLNKPPLQCDIDVKIFTVPSTAQQKKIPFTRVNHAKYMVTDRVLYIGTSNWSENYFSQTAGVGLVVNQTGSEVQEGQETLQSQAAQLFLRDWTSRYAASLSVNDVDVCPRGAH